MAEAATKLLQQQFKRLLTDPVEGFACELFDEKNLFDWKSFLVKIISNLTGPSQPIF